MTKEEFIEELERHKFNSCVEFFNLIEEYQKMSPADKFSMAKEEYDADYNLIKYFNKED